MKRRDKSNYYLDVAETILNRSTCLRRNFGAVKNKNDIMNGFIKRIERIKKEKERNQDVQSNDS